MKDRISALMDGELDERSAADAIEACAQDGEAREAWRTYHLISDAMRDSRVLSPGFARARRAAPRRGADGARAAARAAPSRARWLALSAAASFAAVALVGWLAFAPAARRGAAAGAGAQAGGRGAAGRRRGDGAASAANDYLLAHQGFSPRISLQGMAPYVRTVSGDRREAQRK